MKQEMEKRKQGKSEGNEKQKWVHDASVDYKGRVPLRASTGVWKASLFVLGKKLIYLTIYIIILFKLKFATIV